MNSVKCAPNVIKNRVNHLRGRLIRVTFAVLFLNHLPHLCTLNCWGKKVESFMGKHCSSACVGDFYNMGVSLLQTGSKTYIGTSLLKCLKHSATKYNHWSKCLQIIVLFLKKKCMKKLLNLWGKMWSVDLTFEDQHQP